MQQTNKYKLNLIETADTFSPDPLNGNMEKVEGELARLDGADAAEAAARKALDQRVVALEAHKLVYGSFDANGSDRTFDLGFTPLALLLCDRRHGGYIFLVVGDQHTYLGEMESNWILKIVTNGFSIRSDGHYFNAIQRTYNYIAFV